MRWSEPAELQDPRPGEGVDVPRLAAFLKGKLDGADEPLRLRQFGGGMANLTYLLSFGGRREYVYRRPPMGSYAPSAHDMSREYRVLSRLHSVFPYAPQVFLFVDDESVMGAPFLIMERKRGTTVRRRMPDNFARLTDAPRHLSRTLIDVLVEFHAVDYAAIGLERLGRPEGFLERQVAGWTRRWRAAMTSDNRDADALCDWLRENLPASPKATLAHNDYKLDNTIFAADDPSRMVAVLDWDMCTLGDPLLDLATVLAYWTAPGDPPHLRQLTPMPTGFDFLTRRELIERYESKSGRDMAHIRFYLALAFFRWSVFLQQMHFNFVQGRTRDERYRRLNLQADLLVKTALAAAAGEIV